MTIMTAVAMKVNALSVTMSEQMFRDEPNIPNMVAEQ